MTYAAAFIVGFFGVWGFSIALRLSQLRKRGER